MQIASGMMALFSVLIPARIWYPPDQALKVSVKSDVAVNLVLVDFYTGKSMDTDGSTEISPGSAEVDLRELFKKTQAPSRFASAACYILYAVPKGKPLAEFVGTPLVVEVRVDKRAPGEGPIVIKIEPLRYAVMSTDHGDMTLAFYYDVAPNTVTSFLTLAEEGFYDGLTFHRIVPGFVVQGGDPRGTGIGGPGYQVDAEFNDRLHEEGVLSMARSGDPLEPQGMPPRSEFANSAGSQFFICLGRTEHLDKRYTAFGKVVAGMDTFRSMAKVPLVGDPRMGRPEKPPVVRKLEVRTVTSRQNPYKDLFPQSAKPESTP